LHDHSPGFAAKPLFGRPRALVGRRAHWFILCWSKAAQEKSKAASIKLTLAAVTLDADILLRPCTNGLIHDRSRRKAGRARLRERAPLLVGVDDQIKHFFVVCAVHQILSA